MCLVSTGGPGSSLLLGWVGAFLAEMPCVHWAWNVTAERSCLRELHGPPTGQLCDHPLWAAAGPLPFCQGRRDFPASSISCHVLLLTSMWIFMSSESHCCPTRFLVSSR